MQTPWPTELYDVHAGCKVPCKVTPLTAETAQERIDLTWWTRVDKKSDEDDAHWDWFGYIRKRRRNKKFRFHALRTDDHAVQAAVILETNVRTPNYPAGVFVRNLSSAPENRLRLVGEKQRYRGCGTKLVVFSALVSYLMGADGALIGYPFERAVEFYTKLGFSPTEIRDGNSGLTLYEMSPAAAMQLLEQHGALDQ